MLCVICFFIFYTCGALTDICFSSGSLPPSRIQSPRQSLTESKPVIPPRPGSTVSLAQRTTSPEQTSPFSDDDAQSSDSLPPPIPSRPQPLPAHIPMSNSIRSLAATLDDSTKTSYDNDVAQASPQSVMPPPPPRKRPATSPAKRENGFSSASLPIQSLSAPPLPLPVCRSTIVDPEGSGR